MRKISDERVGRQSHSNWEVNGETPAIRAALAVAQDYPIFPCALIPGSGGKSEKKPLVRDWPHEASQDAAIVRKWWAKYPDAYVGVPMGPRSGLVALDVDPKGRSWFETHRARLGGYRTHGTQRGRHLLYQYPKGTAVRNSASEVAEGVDVRGDGGFLLWWPAHGGISIGEPGELPGWLGALLGKRGVTKLRGSSEAPDGRDQRRYQDGARNVALSARAYHYRKMGMSTREVGQALLQYDQEHCEPPYQQTNGKAAVLYIARKKAHLTTDAQDAKRKAETTRIVSRTMDEVPEERVDWLWKGFLARNKVHIIAGAGATMKSTLTLSMAATITRGEEWPDGTKCPRGNVILWTGEDDLGDTVKPRFRWAGGDQTCCTVIQGVDEEGTERSFDPGNDVELLDRECTRIGDVSLIIIDPIVVIVQKDNNSVSDVRRALVPLQHLAKKHHCVVLGIQHFNKGSKGKDPVERITGSGGWSQAPRIVLATAPINDGSGMDPTKYVFTCIKTFAKKQKGGYEYGFEEEPRTEIARTVWGSYLDGTGHTIITEAEGGDDGESKLGAAKKMLRGLLEKGSMNGFQLAKHIEDAGIKTQTYVRARNDLKLVKFKAGKNMWRWSLPNED